LKEADLIALMVDHDKVLAHSFHGHTLVSLPAYLSGYLLITFVERLNLALQIVKVSLPVLASRCCTAGD
jgi:hypothetical protein